MFCFGPYTLPRGTFPPAQQHPFEPYQKKNAPFRPHPRPLHTDDVDDGWSPPVPPSLAKSRLCHFRINCCPAQQVQSSRDEPVLAVILRGDDHFFKMSPLAAIFTFMCSVGVSRPWPLLSHVPHLGGDPPPEGLHAHALAAPRRERVLNFISLPVTEECVSDDGRRTGICLNVYECKIQQGVSHGKCALGFGVCCIFSATCGATAINNLTYFVNPNFPGLSPEARLCEFTIKKLAPHISQIKFDFVHFSLAQPNRKTGVCENDAMIIQSEGNPEFELCGLNNGQHIYYDVEGVKEPIKVVMNLTKEPFDRLWEIKVTQVEFRNKAPPGCLQYHTEPSGKIQTMNFGENGRHLANQDYTICVRQEEGTCSIVYEPCDENSFKIGPPMWGQDEGSGYGATGDGGPDEDCADKVLMPCDSEEFITANDKVPGVCSLLHCGSSFCPQEEFPCRIESSTTPFNIRVQFGKAIEGESPDDNLGMCLKYELQSCY